MNQNRDAINDILNDFQLYAAGNLKIKTKTGGIKPFIMNRAQLYLRDIADEMRASTGMVRILVLKARQQGISTLINARGYHQTVTNIGRNSFILTHRDDATKNLFDMIDLFYQESHHDLKPVLGEANAGELKFKDLKSGYRVGTAGSRGVGRSMTIQFLHGSEVAHWVNAKEHISGLSEAVPRSPGTEIWYESTAYGNSGEFYRLWQDAEAGRGDFKAVFIPWFWSKEYSIYDGEEDISKDDLEYGLMYGLTNAQLRWRRNKIIAIGEDRFKQEYPATSQEAFMASAMDSFISFLRVEAARKNSIVNGNGPIIVGVDPARNPGAGDRTVIVVRQGRKMLYGQAFYSDDTMSIVGEIRHICSMFRVQYIQPDVIGIGAGIVDRLRELGFPVRPVNAASTHDLMNPEAFSNKRAEMWSEMKDWLADPMGVMILDNQELVSDLLAPKYKFNSSGKLVLESKQDMKKRGVRSPDYGDALAHTFAFPVMSSSEFDLIPTQEQRDWTI